MSEESEDKSGPSYFSQDAYRPVQRTPQPPPSEGPDSPRPTPSFSQGGYTPVGSRTRTPSKVQAPFVLPLAMLVVCFVLAFVDLTFLNEVIGEVLNVGLGLSLVVSTALGLVGLAFMMHLGYEEFEKPDLGFMTKFLDYSIWLLLGLAIATTRFYTASIVDDIKASDDVALVRIFGTEARPVDVLFAPIMFLLYIITGLGAKRALHGLLQNAGFSKWRQESKAAAAQKKLDDKEIKQNLLQTREQSQKEIEAKKKQDLAEREARKRQQLADKEADRKAMREVKQSEQAAKQPINQANAVEELKLKEARKRHAETQRTFHKLDAKFRQSSQRATDLLAKLEGVEAEASALLQRRDNMLDVISNSEKSVQQAVAMIVHSKTQEPISELEAVIAAHNAQKQNPA